MVASLLMLAAQLMLALAHASVPRASPLRNGRLIESVARARLLAADVVSPFDPVTSEDSTKAGSGPLTGPLPLTPENVELVLDSMRPYLLADGGNVELKDIDGATVRRINICMWACIASEPPIGAQVILELQGACGTCPSSSMTMKFGLERGLLEKIPEIVAVEQVSADGELLTEEAVEEVLQPFA
ncbi:MAG: hypothetical protein SGPRY_014857 [Prymnesium sp.]